MDALLRDLRFTLRNMARSPGLAIVIATSLALGIGANTAIFSLIHAVMAYVSTLLFGLSPRDPVTLTMTAGMLITIASLAGYLPARRAALVDPARALKQD